MSVQSQASDVVVDVALVVAAGRGARMGDHAAGPKQYRDLGGRPVLSWSIEALAEIETLREIATVIHADDADLYQHAAGFVPRRVPLGPPVVGGATRQQSVLNGLEDLAKRWPGTARVAIHDGVRPFVTAATLHGACRAVDVRAPLDAQLGAVPGCAVVDTMVAADPQTTQISSVVPRDGVFAVETPQVFRLDVILEAHRKAVRDGFEGTDDASVFRQAGGRVVVTPGSRENFKITTLEDLARARAVVGQVALPDVRTGQGFDVHTFGPGDHVWLGGVRVAHTQGVVAHSDGDVVLHALTDALLGTIADRDIGYHFRNTDPRWRGAASARFFEDAVRRVREAGGEITLLDATVLAEAPKVGPHRDAMCVTIAEIAGIDARRVSIKATTTEQLGAFGRREGLAALATATVVFRRG